MALVKRAPRFGARRLLETTDGVSIGAATVFGGTGLQSLRVQIARLAYPGEENGTQFAVEQSG
jgi:hypothetical protein